MGRPQVSTLLALGGALLGGGLVGGVLLGAPAHAADAPATTCTPDKATACVGVLVLDPHNDLLGGIHVTVTGPDDVPLGVTTTADSLISVPVTVAGTYTVAVDPVTFPDELALPDGVPDSQEIDATLGSTGRAVFRGGSLTAEPRETTAGADDSDGASAGVLWAMIGAVALVAVAVLLVLLRRRRPTATVPEHADAANDNDNDAPPTEGGTMDTDTTPASPGPEPTPAEPDETDPAPASPGPAPRDPDLEPDRPVTGNPGPEPDEGAAPRGPVTGNPGPELP